MLELLQVDHVGLRVSDIDRSIAFYRLLGFEQVCDAGYSRGRPIIMCNANGLVINLLGPATAGSGANILMDEERKFTGYTHVAFRVPKLQETVECLSTREVEITGGPIRFFTGMESVFIRDPDRNVIEITENREDYSVVSPQYTK